MIEPATSERPRLSDRERELGGIIRAYSEVTERLKVSHERLNAEVVRLRQELERKNEELRRRDRLAALGEMAAGLAHEVRNPLGGIALYASMLEAELMDAPEALAAAKKISKGVASLEQLVSEILDFAQEDRLDKQVIALGAVLDEVLESIRPWAEEHEGTVLIEPEARETDVYCDPPRLRRVLLNLLMNGLQSGGKGCHVRLSAKRRRPTAQHGEEIEIEVKDDGPGIPVELLDRVFNPFVTTRAAGTGLGLAIVHRIIEAHAGTVHASNRAEGGARFLLRLPIKGKE